MLLHLKENGFAVLVDDCESKVLSSHPRDQRYGKGVDVLAQVCKECCKILVGQATQTHPDFFSYRVDEKVGKRDEIRD